MKTPPPPGSCDGAEHALTRRAFLHGAVAAGAAFGGFGHLFSAATAAEAKKKQRHVLPDLSKYDVLLSNYNGQAWPKE